MYYCSLPIKIGTKVSVKSYNAFLEDNESIRLKFYRENKNVYIVDMPHRDHEAVVVYLIKRFEKPNGDAMICPITVCGAAGKTRH